MKKYMAKALDVGIMRKLHPMAVADRQGLTLIHIPAQLKRFVWDRGCA
jgi:hypothetical protein